jgi:FixJ family two-component response regulator
VKSVPAERLGEPAVFVVDDDDEIRGAITLLMKSIALRAVAFPTPQAFLAAYERDHYPGCLLLDLRMPGMSGLDLFNELKRRGSCMPAIIMTGHGDVSIAVRAMKAGVFDFIEKPFKDQALLDLIQQALAQCSQTAGQATHRGEIAARARTLTPREREVMDQVVTGKLNKLIASDLNLSTRTVELHRARVMEKMGAKNFSDLLRMAIALQSDEQRQP